MCHRKVVVGLGMRSTLVTNICSYILQRKSLNMVERFATLDHEQLLLSAIFAAQLAFGTSKFGEPRFQSAVEAWLAGFDVHPWTLNVTQHYGQIRATIKL